MSRPQGTDLKTYNGSCQCGAFAYELKAPEDLVTTVCNCSICSKKGFLSLFPGDDANLIVTKGDVGALKEYGFSAKKTVHRFCGTCGTPIMTFTGSFPPGKKRNLNARTITDIDVWNLKPNRFDGAKLEPKYEPPVYSGPEPTAELKEGGMVYHGSCHCGGVQLAVQTDGVLDDGGDHGVLECNCTGCQRTAYITLYPSRNQVSVHDPNNLLRHYAFGVGLMRKTFCSVCGVHVLMDVNDALTDDQVAALPPKAREWRDKMGPHFLCVTARVLEGVDLEKIKRTTRWDGRSMVSMF